MFHIKRFIIIGCCLMVALLGGCATSPTMSPTVYSPPTYSAGSVVAVWNLENLSVMDIPMLNDANDVLTAAVSETLKEKGNYQIIERQRLLLALEELNLGSSALTDETSRLEVGRIVGAQLMVFGGYQQVGGQFRVDLRMIEVQSGAVIRTGEKTAVATELSGWLQTTEDAAKGLL